ncbi:MAG: hypothetical protein R2814_04455 [Flavobacteriaceae bacterium]
MNISRIIVVITAFFLFGCNGQSKAKKDAALSCQIEKDSEIVLKMIVQEEKKIQPVFSSLDKDFLRQIQFGGNVLLRQDFITINGTDYLIVPLEKKNKSPRITIFLNKENCDKASFEVAFMNEDYGRVVSGQIENIDGNWLLTLTGESDIN